MMKTVFKFLLPLLLLAIGVGVAIGFVKTKPKTKRKRPVKVALLVDAVALQPTQRRVQVVAMGTVVPERSITLQPEVSGLLRHEGVNFEEGARLKKGEVIARIDDRDYKAAVTQREADVIRARFDVTQERGRARVAKREWKLLDKGIKSTPLGRSLALRKPHLEAAEARVKAAKSMLEQARLRVERTVLRAPFAAVVRSKRAAVGQLVGPQTPLAQLVATERFLVQVAVPVERLAWIAVPGLNAKEGAPARIVQQTGGKSGASRQGRVLRILGDLAPPGRMARLMVAIDNPLDALAGKAEDTAPLLLGAYVQVSVQGRELRDVFEIPRMALREGDNVWLLGAKNKLVIRSVDVAWREAETLLIRAGLKAGERLVTSAIASPVPGMDLRPRKASGGTRTARAGGEAER